MTLKQIMTPCWSQRGRNLVGLEFRYVRNLRQFVSETVRGTYGTTPLRPLMILRHSLTVHSTTGDKG